MKAILIFNCIFLFCFKNDTLCYERYILIVDLSSLAIRILLVLNIRLEMSLSYFIHTVFIVTSKLVNHAHYPQKAQSKRCLGTSQVITRTGKGRGNFAILGLVTVKLQINWLIDLEKSNYFSLTRTSCYIATKILLGQVKAGGILSSWVS